MIAQEIDAAGERDFFALLRTSVQLWIVVLFMGVAFMAGVVVEGLGTPPTQRFDAPPAADAGPPAPPPIAGPLTDEQVNSGLPTDHPAVDPADAPATGSPSGSTPAPADAPASPSN